MLVILPQSADGIVGLAVEGTLTHDDYRKIIPYLEQKIEEAGPIRLLCDMERFAGMELQAMWDDLKFGLQHMKDFEKLAVIGDRRWLEWCVAVTGALVRTEVRYFEPARKEDAWAWLRETEPPALKTA